MGKLLIALPVLLVVACCSVHKAASVGLNPDAEIKYFEKSDMAPNYRQIEVFKADGFVGLFHMPTYEKAVEQAKARARKIGGNCVVFQNTRKASDVITPFDAVMKTTSDLNQKAKGVDKYLSENMDQDQVFWYFIIGEIEK